MQGNALIRSNFHVIEPDKLQLSKWKELYAEAMWLEGWKLQNWAQLISGMLGGKKSLH